MLSSRTLGERIGADAYLKAECFQRTGSFKPRSSSASMARPLISGEAAPSDRATSVATEPERTLFASVGASGELITVAWA